MRFASFLVLLVAACGGAATSPSTETPVDEPPAKTGETNDRRTGSVAPSAPSPATWCTTAGDHDFCADFDGENPLGSWDHATRGNDRNQKDVDELVVSDRSSPNALRISGADISSEGHTETTFPLWSGMFLVQPLPTTTTSTKATVSFDLYVAKAKWHTNVVSLNGRTSTNGIAFGVRFSVGEEGSWLSAAVGEIPKLPAIDQGRWVRVEIAIDDNGGTGGIAALAFDGTNAGTVPFDGSLASSAETTLYLGVSRSAPSEAYDVRYDNVIADLK